jgi:uncharacterized protein with PQ loop repeat
MTTNPLSTVGLMLTLAGLVGSFFNIQLSQWLRDLIALEQKVELNKWHGTDTQQKAIVECRIEYKKLANIQTYVLHALVLGFVVFVLSNGLLMIRGAEGDPLFLNINVALWVFLVFFVGVSAWLVYGAWGTAKRTKAMLDNIKPAG